MSSDSLRKGIFQVSCKVSEALHLLHLGFPSSVVRGSATLNMTPNAKLVSLPPEVVHTILSHLSASQLSTIATVSRTLCEAAQSASLWQRFAPDAENPRHDYLLSCAWRSGRAVHTETRLLFSLCRRKEHNPVVTSLNVTRFPVECAHEEKEGFITVGSARGEVVRVNLRTSQKQFFVGPCSCPVTAVCVNRSVVIAGFAHRVRGNGHTSSAVAWDRDSGCRLATFGGGAVRSSWAFPTAAVRDVFLGNERVGLLCGSVVTVYETRSWRCLIQVGFENVVRVDMNDGKLAVVVMKDGTEILHVIDFEKALKRWPWQVERIQQ